MPKTYVPVQFYAGPLDGYVSDLLAEAVAELPREWWPKTMRHCGFYELIVEDHGDHRFCGYRWHEGGRA